MSSAYRVRHERRDTQRENKYMFIAKKFYITDDAFDITNWLNTLEKPGHGVRVVSTSQNGDILLIIASIWKIAVHPLGASFLRDIEKTTIDEIPDEPSINYPDDEEPV
jgi:hypothetical protein